VIGHFRLLLLPLAPGTVCINTSSRHRLYQSTSEDLRLLNVLSTTVCRAGFEADQVVRRPEGVPTNYGRPHSEKYFFLVLLDILNIFLHDAQRRASQNGEK